MTNPPPRKSKSELSLKLDKHYGKIAADMIRQTMADAGVSYSELRDRLEKAGRPIELYALRNHVSRGTFSAAWFVQVMELLGADQISWPRDKSKE